jgi:predicted metal-binding membrane protein
MTETAVNAVLRRDRAIVIAAITTISVLAWTYTLWHAAQISVMEMPAPPAGSGGMAGMNMPDMVMPGASGTMSGMNMGGMSAAAELVFRPWSVADFAFMFIMWTVMMVGMMTPSVAPMVLLYATVGRNAAASGRPLAAPAGFSRATSQPGSPSVSPRPARSGY